MKGMRINLRASIGWIVALSATYAIADPAQARSTAFPVDQCLHLPGYIALRDELHRIVRDKDAAAIIALADDKITWSFGGDNDKAQFIEEWGLQGPHSSTSAIFPALADMLKWGCNGDGQQIELPYFQYEAGNLEEEQIGIVIGDNVQVREGNSAASRALASLSWSLVNVVNWAGDHLADDKGAIIPNPAPWHQVELEDGRKGYVRADFIRSIADQRAGFTRRNNHWVMTDFLAGD